jgi:hypothetical protein
MAAPERDERQSPQADGLAGNVAVDPDHAAHDRRRKEPNHLFRHSEIHP